MGKLAVVFFAALALQGVLGGIIRGYGNDREELRDVVHQIASVTEDIYQTLHSTTWRHESTWQNREFVQDVEEIISYLEELTTMYDGQLKQVVFNILRELREVHMYMMKLTTNFEQHLQMTLRSSFKQLVKSVQMLEEIFEEEHIRGAYQADITKLWKKIAYTLTNIYENMKTSKWGYFDRENVYSTDFESHPYSPIRYSDKYDQSYYGTFTKYFNNIFGQSDKYTSKYFTYPKTTYGYNKRFGGDYQPEYSGYSSRKYSGVYDPEYTYENTHSYFPKTFDYDTKRYNSEWMYSKNFETFPDTYKYKNYETVGQYGQPEYFGKYTYGTTYETKDLETVYENIKNMAKFVTEALRESSMNKQELTVYVRQLIKIVDHFVNHFEQQITKDYKINQVFQTFQEIKEELEHIFTTTFFYQPSQVKYQLINAIEQIVDQFEMLVGFETYSQGQYLKNFFVQFLEYIRNVKYEIKDYVHSYEVESYTPEHKYRSIRPTYRSFSTFSSFPSVGYEQY